MMPEAAKNGQFKGPIDVWCPSPSRSVGAGQVRNRVLAPDRGGRGDVIGRS